MQEDGPVTPNPDSYFPPEREEPGGTPTWPVDTGRSRSSSTSNATVMLLGASLGLNAALFIALVSVLILGHTTLFGAAGSPAGSSGSLNTGSTAHSILSTPTAGATTTPDTGWLQISPASIQLSCNQNEIVTLQNSGPQQVQWQAIVSTPGDTSGVQVGPNQGTLDPGHTMQIQIQYQPHHNNSQGAQQGTVQFSPMTPDAGAGPILSYTTVGCG